MNTAEQPNGGTWRRWTENRLESIEIALRDLRVRTEDFSVMKAEIRHLGKELEENKQAVERNTKALWSFTAVIAAAAISFAVFALQQIAS